MTSRKETTEASAPKGAPRKAASPDQSLTQQPNSTAVGHSELPADGKGHQTLTRESLSQGRQKPKRNQHSRAQKLNLCRKKTFKKKRAAHPQRYERPTKRNQYGVKKEPSRTPKTLEFEKTEREFKTQGKDWKIRLREIPQEQKLKRHEKIR